MAATLIFGDNVAGDTPGVTGVPAYGQREQFLFSNNWLVGDLWQITLVASDGDATVGSGTFSKTVDASLNVLTPTICFTYKNRIYLGLGSEFAFSDNGDPTSFEVQAPGAGFVTFLSYFGSQDSVTTIQQLQGRLIVFGSRCVQIWTVDADPANFSFVQEMENIGTSAPQSAQNIGDYDVIFLDPTGFRSVRQREVTLNAYVDDVGIPIDELVQGDLEIVNANTCVSIVEPATKRYWGYLNGKIYVLSRYPSAKISAWSTYECKDSNGAAFVPTKFIVFNNIVYCRTVDGRLIAFGGGNGQAYDGSILTVELPWLNDKTPKEMKYGKGMDVGCMGQWNFKVTMDPKTFAVDDGASLQPVWSVPAAKGDEAFDSSFDLQNVSFSQRGTHWKLICATDPTWTDVATLSEIQFHYDKTK